MLWETAAPLSLSVLLGGKPRRNSQFGPLQGVYMCLCVIGMETSVLARDSQQWIFFFSPPLATHNHTRTHKHEDWTLWACSTSGVPRSTSMTSKAVYPLAPHDVKSSRVSSHMDPPPEFQEGDFPMMDWITFLRHQVQFVINCFYSTLQRLDSFEFPS